MLLAVGEIAVAELSKSNIRSNVDVAKLPIFNGEAEKIADFLIACKLFIKIKIRDVVVKEQIQWVLLYMQGESADV